MKRFPLLLCLAILLILLIPGIGTAAGSDPTLSSIIPSSGEVNTTVKITALNGTNFASSAGFRLKTSSGTITGSVSSITSTLITGTINLNNQVPGDYQVCVYNNATSYACGLSFTITSPGETATSSSIFFETYPEGTAVLLNGVRIGTGVFTYYNVTPGTYKVLVQKTRYEDYSGSVTVLAGKRARVYASLIPVGAGAPVATATKVPTPTTIRKSTLQVPTSWPSTTPTQASPFDPVLIAASVGIGLGIAVFRRQ